MNTALHVLKAQVAFKQGGAAVDAGLNELQASVISSPSQSPNAWQVRLVLCIDNEEIHYSQLNFCGFSLI